MLRAIRAVARGEMLLDPAVTRSVTDRLVRLAARTRDDELPISEREKEVLVLVAQGLTNKEIAVRLIVSEKTARNHVSHILEKLGFSRRSEAAAYAVKRGLLSPEPPRR
ncbi:MAG: response regulator transcription factor [Chloroflexi bacterium]|nr:response regulator transcription factor [Chloroflexota bacterium]